MTASRTTPTLCVFVIITGPSRKPDSSTHVVPVISPFPFSDHHPANTGAFIESLPRGRTAVTPVRTGPLPICSLPSPEMSVVCPTVTPETSVIPFSGPGVPSNGTPRSRARGLAAGFSCAKEEPARRQQPSSTDHFLPRMRMIGKALQEFRVLRNGAEIKHRSRSARKHLRHRMLQRRAYDSRFGRGNAKRRRQQNVIAVDAVHAALCRVREHILFQRRLADFLRDVLGLRKRLARLLVLHEFHAQQQPEPPDV